MDLHSTHGEMKGLPNSKLHWKGQKPTTTFDQWWQGNGRTEDQEQVSSVERS